MKYGESTAICPVVTIIPSNRTGQCVASEAAPFLPCFFWNTSILTCQWYSQLWLIWWHHCTQWLPCQPHLQITIFLVYCWMKQQSCTFRREMKWLTWPSVWLLWLERNVLQYVCLMSSSGKSSWAESCLCLCLHHASSPHGGSFRGTLQSPYARVPNILCGRWRRSCRTQTFTPFPLRVWRDSLYCKNRLISLVGYDVRWDLVW